MKIDEMLTKKICFLYCDKQYSMAMIAEKLGISVHKIQYWLEKNNIPRRNRSESTYLAYLHRFHKIPCNIKKKLTPKENELLIAGVMLYWAEGSKKNNPHITFSNSDPKMIQLFLKFLRQICGIHEKRLKVLLHLYRNQDERKLKKWWSRIAGVPLNQFHASYIHKGKLGTYKKKSEVGTVSLRYYDKKLYGQVLQWIDDYINKFLKPA